MLGNVQGVVVQAIILVEGSSSSGKFMMTGGREEVEGGEGGREGGGEGWRKGGTDRGKEGERSRRGRIQWRDGGKEREGQSAK